MNVVFRVDAASHIGSGHLMRCLVLADALRGHGVKSSFICRDHPGNLSEVVRRRGFTVNRLNAKASGTVSENIPPHAAWLGTSWQEDSEQSCSVIETMDTKPDWLVVDHYALDRRWERTMRPLVGRIMVIDDLADREHDCDLLLDQNLVANMHERYARKISPRCELLLGPQYALLQPIYAELHEHVPCREGVVHRIFIFFGNVDSANLSARVLSAFLRLNRPDIEVDLVVGTGNRHANLVSALAAGHDNIHLHHDLPALASLMAQADLAIGAGGTTSWERLCLGLPTLVVTLADNQLPITRELSERGLVRWLGHRDEVDERTISIALGQHIQQGLEKSWSLRCSETVDGRGAGRLCSALTVTAGTPLRMRAAEPKDEMLLLSWANDPDARKNAFSQDTISTEAHRGWFRKRLNDVKGCRIYIAETHDGVALGQVRFEWIDMAWEVDYALAPIFRGRGIGRSMLETALLRLRGEVSGGLVYGRVKNENHASRNVFESLGFDSRSDSKFESTTMYERSL